MEIKIKHIDHENIIILSMFSTEDTPHLVNEFNMNGCMPLSEGQIMNKSEFYSEYRKMQRLGCTDKSIETLVV